MHYQILDCSTIVCPRHVLFTKGAVIFPTYLQYHLLFVLLIIVYIIGAVVNELSSYVPNVGRSRNRASRMCTVQTVPEVAGWHQCHASDLVLRPYILGQLLPLLIPIRMHYSSVVLIVDQNIYSVLSPGRHT